MTGEAVCNVGVSSGSDGASVRKRTVSGFPCRLCTNSHETRLCTEFVDADDRVRAFSARFQCSPCAVCFDIQHNGDCDPRLLCRLKMCSLSDKHSIVLCPVNIRRAQGLLKSVHCCSQLPWQSGMGSSGFPQSVALETAVLSVLNPECLHLPPFMRHFSLLGDIGSQRTLISESCARRLNLQVVRHEVLALRGYGQSSCAPQAYKVVKVILGKFPGGRTVEFDALVVPGFQPLWM